jgi:hypothetical protein
MLGKQSIIGVRDAHPLHALRVSEGCLIAGPLQRLHPLVLWISTHFSDCGWLGASADGTFEMVLEMCRAEDVSIIAEVLPACIDGTPRAAEHNSISHQRLNNTCRASEQ